MQIREQGNRYQIIRNTYTSVKNEGVDDAVKGRTVAKMVGSFLKSDLSNIPASAFAKLTDQEIAEVKTWRDVKLYELRQVEKKAAPALIVEQLKSLAGPDSLHYVDDAQAQAIRDALSELLAARRTAKKRSK